jgi:pSer/pThr/pTyr-binding forkhead associated (FHA) protein
MTEISKSHLLVAKSSANIAELQAKELERKLSLYQVFLKLYEHHRGLLEEILQLEHQSQPCLTRLKPYYAQGIVNDAAVYLVTNLSENQTQTLIQPQQIWTVGRDRHNGIYVADKYLSRRHAAIQYLEHGDQPGFYLVDFNSTNGSFVNGERVYEQMKLKDGDRIRLGNMTFDFFFNHSCRILPTVAMELLMQLVPRKGNGQDETLSNLGSVPTILSKMTDQAIPISQNYCPIDYQEYCYDGLSSEQKSDILDRFFSNFPPYQA